MKSPAFQFYPTDWLGSQRVQMLTLEEEGAYIRLVSSCWQHGSIPSDPDQCARIVGKGCSTTVARVVQAMFHPSHEIGRLVHERLDLERIKQADWREKSSLGGKKSAEMRKNSRVVEPPFKRDATNHLATLPLSPSPLLSSKGEVATAPERAFKKQTPTLEEVKLTCGKTGIPDADAVWFWNKCEANGWTNGGRPIKSYPHTLAAWKAAGYLPSQKNGKAAKSPGGNF
jgi:uncharacterized protein YdaU (DUF1376 family)